MVIFRRLNQTLNVFKTKLSVSRPFVAMASRRPNSSCERNYKNSIQVLHDMMKPANLYDYSVNIQHPPFAKRDMVEYLRRAGYKPSDLNDLNIVHIAGTKGKGSTAAFCESILRNSGKKTGMFTSPHIVSFRERIVIDGKPISEELFVKYFWEVWDRLQSHANDPSPYDLKSNDAVFPPIPKFFSLMTIMAFHAFKLEAVDDTILEVGVGGEYDSTNVITAPVCCAITSLDIDHTHSLGKTMKEISWQKGGIFKKDSTCFSVLQNPIATTVLDQRAEELGVKSLNYVSTLDNLPKLGIKGDVQNTNASLAIRICHHVLRLPENPSLLPTFAKGLEEASIPARCQKISKGSITWLVDGAHTPESIKHATKWFLDVKDDKMDSYICIYFTKDRDIPLLTSNLLSSLPNGGLGLFKKVLICINLVHSSGTTIDGFPCRNPTEHELNAQKILKNSWHKLLPADEIVLFETADKAVKFLEAENIEKPKQVFVVGSFLLAGTIIEAAELSVFEKSPI